MTAFWSGSVRTFVDTPAAEVAGVLAYEQIGHFRVNEVQQRRAWESTIAMLRAATSRSSANDLPAAVLQCIIERYR